ncbi:MAG TPA: heparin lyase I family protein [Pirellulales bacterium]|jgi:hypothetical protein
MKLSHGSNLFTIAIASIAIGFSSWHCCAETFTHITAEEGAIDYDFAKDPANGTYTEPGSDYHFKLTFKQGQRSTPQPVLVATIRTTTAEHFRGKSALQMQIVDRDEVDTVKAAYKVSIDSEGPRDKFSPLVKEPKDWYHGFAMKIDADYFKLPEQGELLFEQWWQSSPFHPPVSMVIVGPKDATAHGWNDAGPNGHFALLLRDDEHNALNNLPGQPQYYDLGPAIVGRWMRWVVHVRPSAAVAEGAIDVSLDGREKLNLAHVKVGYDPEHPQYADHKPSIHLAGVNVCLYRMNGQNNQRFYFDEIKFADRFEDAEPK